MIQSGEMVVLAIPAPNKKRMKSRVIIGIVLGGLLSFAPLSHGQEQEGNRDYQYALIEAVKQKNLGNLAEAIKLYRLVIKDKPDCAVAYFEAGSIYLVTSQFELARNNLSQSYALDPGNEWYTIAYLNSLGALEDYEEVVEILKEKIKSEPDKTDWEFKLALTYFNGWEDIPTFSAAQYGAYQVALVMDPANAVLESNFRKTQMIGFDFDGGIGKVAINTELAYFITEDTDNLDPCLKNPYIQWVLGLEYDFPLGITGGLQYSQEFQTGTGDNSLVVTSGLGMDLGFFTSQAVGCGLEKKFGEGEVHSAELFAFLSLSGDNGYMVSPSVKLSQSDSVNVYLGATFYGGTADSILGDYSDNSNVFANVKYSF